MDEKPDSATDSTAKTPWVAGAQQVLGGRVAQRRNENALGASMATEARDRFPKMNAESGFKPARARGLVCGSSHAEAGGPTKPFRMVTDDAVIVTKRALVLLWRV